MNGGLKNATFNKDASFLLHLAIHPGINSVIRLVIHSVIRLVIRLVIHPVI